MPRSAPGRGRSTQVHTHQKGKFLEHCSLRWPPAVLCRRLLALLALGALPKLLDPMRRAKANREGCLCLGPILDLAQVRSVDMYTEQRVSPAPNAERQHCEALVELIEEAIARRERKLHEEEPPLLPTTSALTSTTAVRASRASSNDGTGQRSAAPLGSEA